MQTAELEDVPTDRSGILDLIRRVMEGGRLPLLLASMGINVLALALPIFILQIYDRILPNGATMTLFVLIVGLVVALVFDTALRALRAYVAAWNGARFEHMVRYRAVERLLRAPLGDFERSTPGSYLEQINAVGSMRDFHASQLLLAAVDLPFACVFLALIAYLGSWLVLGPLVLLVGFGALAFAIGRALRDSAAERAAADKRRYDFVIEALRGIHTVKALALNAAMLRRAEPLQEDSAFAIERVMYQSTLAQTIGGLFSQINMVVLVAFGALLVLDGRMTMGALAACTLLSGRALQPLQTAMGLWGDLTFRRETRVSTLIESVNLTVRQGEIIGIDGDTGSGKSALLLLMLGLLRPERGSVHIDGNDAADIDPDWLRHHIALLPRDGAVYGGSILDNLTNFQEGECVNEALYLSYLLGLDDAVKRLPEGFDTRIGTGEVLPGGLRQRIAIVRELVKQPKIILFDEADHALDANASGRLVDLLRQLGQRSTIVLVSGKPQIMQLAQRRYRLSHGRLLPISVETGKAMIREVA